MTGEEGWVDLGQDGSNGIPKRHGVESCEASASGSMYLRYAAESVASVALGADGDGKCMLEV
jgi:hypothetical protein